MLRHIVYFLLLLGVGLSFPVLLQSQTQPLPEWNQFRGPGHDNKSPVTGIAPSWPDDGPKLLWKRDHLGDGYSNVSFCGDKMYTMGDLGEACQLLALDRVTGKLLWSKKVGHWQPGR